MHGPIERLQSLCAAFAALQRGPRFEHLQTQIERQHGLPRAQVEWALAGVPNPALWQNWLHDFGSEMLAPLQHNIVLSSNLFVVGFAPVFWSLFLGHRCKVRVARNDVGFLSEFRGALHERSADLASQLEIVSFPHDDAKAWQNHLLGSALVTVFGGDAAIAAIAERIAHCAPDARIQPHGHGVGLAYVAPGDADELSALAQDICAYDGRGCLSPVHVAVCGDEQETQASAERLAKEIFERSQQWPRAQLSAPEKALEMLWRDTAVMVGDLIPVADCAVAIGYKRPGVLRNISVASYPTVVEQEALLSQYAPMLTVVGVGKNAKLPSNGLSARTRIAPLGSMQASVLEGLWLAQDGHMPWQGLLR